MTDVVPNALSPRLEFMVHVTNTAAVAEAAAAAEESKSYFRNEKI